MLGRFHDGHPRLELVLNTPTAPLKIEFVVDTGFEGDLALPGYLARQLGDRPSGMRDRALANGAVIRCPFYEIDLEWDGERRTTEVLVLEGSPLLGTHLLLDYLLQVEVIQGGEVSIDPM